eukprot:960305-Rhodomonas_salina.2
MSGTRILTQRVPVLPEWESLQRLADQTWAVADADAQVRPMSLRPPYAMSGTERAYAAPQKRIAPLVRRLPPYAYAHSSAGTDCARMVLPGGRSGAPGQAAMRLRVDP